MNKNPYAGQRASQSRFSNQANKYDYEMMEQKVKQSSASQGRASLKDSERPSVTPKATSLRSSLKRRETKEELSTYPERKSTTVSLPTEQQAYESDQPKSLPLAPSTKTNRPAPTDLAEPENQAAQRGRSPPMRAIAEEGEPMVKKISDKLRNFAPTADRPEMEARKSVKDTQRQRSPDVFSVRFDFSRGAVPIRLDENGLNREGKWVRVDPKDSTADSRGGSSLKGPHIVKEQDRVDLAERFSKKVAAEGKDTSVHFNGFTDRFIRSQDGLAMKAVFTGMRGMDHKASEIGKTKELMQASLLPPAGQVCQVDAGQNGEPPYVLQVECDGVIPMVDRTCCPRHLYKQRAGSPPPILSASRNQDEKEQCLIPRGCEPPVYEDKEHLSLNIKGVLQADEIEPATEDENKLKLRKELGRRGLPRHYAQDFDTDPVHDDAEPPTFRFTKNYGSRIRAIHKWSPTGGPEKILCQPNKDIPKAHEACPDTVFAGTPSFAPKAKNHRSRRAGDFNGKTSYQSIKLNMMHMDHLRYEDSENPRGKNFTKRIRATHHWEDEIGGVRRLFHEQSPPKRTIADVENRSLANILEHDENVEQDIAKMMERSRSCPPPSEHLLLRQRSEDPNRSAGVPSASLGTDRLGHGKRVLGRETITKTGRVLQHSGPERVYSDHENRVVQDEGYATVCHATREIAQSHGKVAKEIKERSQVMGPSDVANVLVWVNDEGRS